VGCLLATVNEGFDELSHGALQLLVGPLRRHSSHRSLLSGTLGLAASGKAAAVMRPRGDVISLRPVGMDNVQAVRRVLGG
jgi:hypothetical protein